MKKIEALMVFGNVLSFFSLLAINNYVFAEMQSIKGSSSSLIWLFISWLPVFIFIGIAFVYTLTMISDKYKSVHIYIYLHLITLILVVFNIIAYSFIILYVDKYLLNVSITILLVSSILFQFFAILKLRKLKFDVIYELEMLKKNR